MARTILIALSGLAMFALLGEGLAAGVLWSQGRLNADAVREIRAILRDPSDLSDENARENKVPAVSTDDVIAARSMRILQIEEREREQELLTALIADSRFNIIAEQTSLKAAKDQFARQEEALRKKRESEAIEQARAVLMKAEIDMAVKQLLELSLDESLIIIQGMPEKKIAELLGAFEKGDKEAQARGTEIFQAISRGQMTADAATEDGQ
ncbi:hypothetical protein GC176_11300 [bacterium]|nr:hypothetical protein [bacterium]